MKARTPTSTVSPPFTVPLTTPSDHQALVEGFLEAGPVLGLLDLQLRKRVVAFRAAAGDADRHDVAHLHARIPLGVAEVAGREDALRLQPDVNKDGLGRHGDNGAFAGAGFLLARALELREHLGKGGGFLRHDFFLKVRDSGLGTHRRPG